MKNSFTDSLLIELINNPACANLNGAELEAKFAEMQNKKLDRDMERWSTRNEGRRVCIVNGRDAGDGRAVDLVGRFEGAEREIRKSGNVVIVVMVLTDGGELVFANVHDVKKIVFVK